jgi:hypothetical protein
MGEVRKQRQPASPGGFSAEEPSSFCSRATPVVPISSVDVFLAKSERRQHSFAAKSPTGVSPGEVAQPTLRPEPTLDNQPKMVLGSEDPGVSEHDFWDSPPAYSAPPSSIPLSGPARPLPSKRRSTATRAAFLAVLLPALFLVAYVLATGHAASWRAVVGKIGGLF